MNTFLKIKSCVFVIILFSILPAYAQRKRPNREPILLKEKKSAIVKSDTEDIVENSETYYYEITLKNFPIGKITHEHSGDFILKVIEKIQELRENKNVVKIEIMGWADGTVNDGILKSGLKLQRECATLCKDTIYDEELAMLRACEIQNSLANGILSHSIELADKIDSHDEKDEENIGGSYRKVVVRILK